jgi:hypothetical protein
MMNMRKISNHFPGIVWAGVVHEYELIATVAASNVVVNAADKLRDATGTVVNRNNN